MFPDGIWTLPAALLSANGKNRDIGRTFNTISILFILNIEACVGIAACATVNGHAIADEYESVMVTGGFITSAREGVSTS